MFNYLAILGRSQDDNREIMNLRELIESFSIGKISLEEVVFEPMKLSWMNAHYIRSLSDADFWKAAESFIPREWSDRFGLPLVRGAALVVRGRAKTLEEVAAEMVPILEHTVDAEAAAAMRDGPARRVLAELLRALDGLNEVTGAEFLRMLEAVRAAAACDKRTVFSSARAAIIGKLEGPEIGAVAELLGAEELRARIERSLRGR
jgi:glutamyl/glutaminyl-tRNA synthetase